VTRQIVTVLVSLPALLQDIVYNLLSKEDGFCTIVLSSASSTDVDVIAAHQPDIVIAGTSTPDGFSMDTRIFAANPRLKVFSISFDGNRAFVTELCPRTMVLGALSPAELVDAIRAAVSRTFDTTLE
jgi:DNA-binding NarL/FixJ family response regulator